MGRESEGVGGAVRDRRAGCCGMWNVIGQAHDSRTSPKPRPGDAVRAGYYFAYQRVNLLGSTRSNARTSQSRISFPLLLLTPALLGGLYSSRASNVFSSLVARGANDYYHCQPFFSFPSNLNDGPACQKNLFRDRLNRSRQWQP